MANITPTKSNCLNDSRVKGSLSLSSAGTVKQAMIATAEYMMAKSQNDADHPEICEATPENTALTAKPRWLPELKQAKA